MVSCMVSCMVIRKAVYPLQRRAVYSLIQVFHADSIAASAGLGSSSPVDRRFCLVVVIVVLFVSVVVDGAVVAVTDMITVDFCAAATAAGATASLEGIVVVGVV